MKNIILLDTAFPYEKVEPFLETEIKYYGQETNILIANCLLNDRSEKRDCGSARVLDIYPTGTKFQRVLSNFFWGIRTLFQKELLQEITNLKKTGKLSFSRLRTLLIFTAHGERCVSNIKKQIPSYLIGSDIIFYSYWMHIHAYAAARLKVMYPGSRFVSRAHRFDLYEENAVSCYIPYRKYIFSHADRVFCISNDGCRYLSEKHPETVEKLELSRLGTINRGEGISPPKNELILVSCSWMVPVKRIHLIVETLSKIDDIPIKWIHFGNGALFDTLKEQAKLLPPNIKVEFLGAVKNSIVHEYYKNIGCHIFINVSEIEGVPVSIMEAMSYGVPVIATDVGGVAEIMPEDDRWILTKDFELDELVSKIRGVYVMSDDDYLALRKDFRTTWEKMSDAGKYYKEFVSRISRL